VFKAAGDLGSINAVYHDTITESLITYLEGGSPAGPRNRFKKGMVEAFGSAFDAGWQDGGGDMPPDGDALDWLNARVEQELGYIDQLFVQAKALRNQEGADFFQWASDRADGYTGTVSSIYNAGRMLAMGNQLLTWHLGQTEQHCETCQSLDGTKHRASWYIAHDYIPRKPGAAMDCKGYNCDCSLTDRKGETISVQ
jgi:hypothetical protein